MARPRAIPLPPVRGGSHFKASVLRTASGIESEVFFTGGELGEGQGLLRIQCCDARESCAERQITSFLVDLTPPEIEPDRLTASPSAEGFDGDISVWVRDAWVLGSVELAYRGKILRHEFPKAYPSTLGIDWDISRVTFAAKDLPLGSGKAIVTARDASGNATSKELALRIDATAPSVTILAPSPSTVVRGSTFVVKVSASDPDNEAPPSIDLWVGGGRVARLDGPLAEIAVDTSALSPGPTEVRAVARDHAGNESTTARVVIQVE